MNFSKTTRILGVSALFVATSLLAFYSVGAEKLRASTNAPLVQGRPAAMLLADGGAPNPPLPPPPPPPQN
jgi:hypothetical protein